MGAKQVVDRIAYTGPFKEELRGRLMARFRLDPESAPMYIRDGDDPRLRHYLIEVFLVTPRAKEIKGVHYYMDDPSYVNPKGFSNNPANEFREEITSYGDVEVVVTVDMGQHKYEQRAWLSNMLENGHADDLTPAIRDALQRIKVN